jgi:uncharacterized protein YerC
MPRRYKFLGREDIYQALNKLRAAFLAARNGSEVDEIINGILTSDEKLKIGRRILISELIDQKLSYQKISDILKVGKQTILQVVRAKEEYPECFKLINLREEKVEKTYQKKAYRKTGNPKYLKKFQEYTGFKRKDVKR